MVTQQSWQHRLRAAIYHHRQKLFGLIFWLTMIGLFWAYTHYHNLTPLDAVKQVSDWFTNSIYGPPLFIICFALQPLVFFPSLVMGIMAGCLYGPVAGLLYAIMGGNGAAWITYSVGRFFGQGMFQEGQSHSHSRIQPYVDRLRDHTFETVVTLDLLFMPFDLVNYTAGFLHVAWRPFVLATLIGTLPGTAMFVLFGASLEGDMTAGQIPSIDPRIFAISLTMIVISLGLSQVMKRRALLFNRLEKEVQHD